MRSFFALGLLVRLAVSLTVANVAAVFLGPSDGILSTVILPALAGGILGIYMTTIRHSAWFRTGAINLLVSWVVAVVIAVALVALFVHSKNGRLEWHYVTDLGWYGVRAVFFGAAAGITALLVVGRIGRLLSRAEAA